MRIGVLTTSYPRSEDDAAGAFVGGFGRWLAREVGEVEVLCAEESRRLFYRGGAPTRLGAWSPLWRDAMAYSSRLAWEVARRRHRWQALVSHWAVPSGLVGAAFASHIPHLAIAHGSDVRMLVNLPGGRRCLEWLATRSDLVFVAEALRGEVPGRVVPMGIEVDEFTGVDRVAARRKFAGPGFTVLYLGRLISQKGVDLAISAVPAQATLLIAGSGPEEPALRACTRPGIRFLGEVRGSMRAEVFAAADVLVVPSRLDGAPTVIVEAMAAGLPVVGTRCGGIPELISHETNGLIVEPTAADLERALVRLRDDAPLRRRLSEAAAVYARSYDWRSIGPRLWKSFWKGRKDPVATGCCHLDVARL